MAINKGVHISFESGILFSLEKFLEVELLGQGAKFFFKWQMNGSQVLVHSCHQRVNLRAGQLEDLYILVECSVLLGTLGSRSCPSSPGQSWRFQGHKPLPPRPPSSPWRRPTVSLGFLFLEGNGQLWKTNVWKSFSARVSLTICCDWESWKGDSRFRERITSGLLTNLLTLSQPSQSCHK